MLKFLKKRPTAHAPPAQQQESGMVGNVFLNNRTAIKTDAPEALKLKANWFIDNDTAIDKPYQADKGGISNFWRRIVDLFALLVRFSLKAFT